MAPFFCEEAELNWTLIVNPRSGRGQRSALRAAARVDAEIVRTGSNVRTVFTEFRGHAGELAREATQRGEGVIVCGGDGSLHEVVNGVDLDALTLGIVPTGRGNDFARALGVPPDARTAARGIAEGQTRKVDVGLGGDVRFLTVACAGLDARVAMKPRARALGRLGYRMGALAEIARGLGPLQDVEIDEDRAEGALIAAFANGGSYGGGLPIAPGADLTDGRLDVCVVRSVGSWDAVRLFGKVARGAHVGHESVRMFRAKTGAFAAPGGRPVVADGEPVGRTPVALEVIPGAVKVVI